MIDDYDIGLDLIPAPWLHMTMQGIGFTDEISASELHSLPDAFTQELSLIDPPTASFHHLTLNPEAIYLKAHLADALYPLRARMYRAVVSVLGANSTTEDMPAPRQFVPHVGIAYVSADGEAQPIARALQTARTTPVTAAFRMASLLEFHRDHRMYEWTSARPIVSGAFWTLCRRESPGTLRACVWLASLALCGRAGGLVRVLASRGAVRRDDAGGAAVR